MMCQKPSYDDDSIDQCEISSSIIGRWEVWTLFDNSGEIPKVIALEKDKTVRIMDTNTYTALVKRYGRV